MSLRFISRRSAAAGTFIAVMSFGLAIAACDWSWEQDNCQDVFCPLGCQDYGGRDAARSLCNMQGDQLCCNCWYKEIYCRLSGYPEYPCTIPTNSPNGKAWLTLREECVGPCTTYGEHMHLCLTATQSDPFTTE